MTSRINMTGDCGFAAHGAVFGPAAPALPFIAGGLSLASGAMQGLGGQAAGKFQAQQAARAAQVGRIKAQDTDTYMRQELETTLGNIHAIRSSVGDSNSPTEDAIVDRQRTIGDRQRQISVFNINAQAQSDANAAQFYNASAQSALFGGLLGGLTSGIGRLI